MAVLPGTATKEHPHFYRLLILPILLLKQHSRVRACSLLRSGKAQPAEKTKGAPGQHSLPDPQSAPLSAPGPGRVILSLLTYWPPSCLKTVRVAYTFAPAVPGHYQATSRGHRPDPPQLRERRKLSAVEPVAGKRREDGEAREEERGKVNNRRGTERRGEEQEENEESRQQCSVGRTQSRREATVSGAISLADGS